MDVDEAYLLSTQAEQNELDWSADLFVWLCVISSAMIFSVMRILDTAIGAFSMPLLAVCCVGFCIGSLAAGIALRRFDRYPSPVFAGISLSVTIALLVLAYCLWPDDVHSLAGWKWPAFVSGALVLASPFAVLGWGLAEAFSIWKARLVQSGALALFGAALGPPLAALGFVTVGAMATLSSLAGLAALLAAWLAHREHKVGILWAGLVLAALLALSALIYLWPLKPDGYKRWDARSCVNIELSETHHTLQIDNFIKVDLGTPSAYSPEMMLPFTLRIPATALIVGAAGDRQALLMRQYGTQAIDISPLVQGVREFLDLSYDFTWTGMVGPAALEAPERHGAYDMVWLPLRADASAVSSGMLTFKSDYTLTAQGIGLAYSALKPNGVMVIEVWPDDDVLLLAMLEIVHSANQLQQGLSERNVFAVKGNDMSMILVKPAGFTDVREMDRLLSLCIANDIDVYHASLAPGHKRFTKATAKYGHRLAGHSAPTFDRPFIFADLMWAKDPGWRFDSVLGVALLLACVLAAVAFLSSTRPLFISRERSRRTERIFAFRAQWAAMLAMGAAPVVLQSLCGSLAPMVGRSDLAVFAMPTSILLGCSIGFFIAAAFGNGNVRQWIKVAVVLLIAYMILTMRGAPVLLEGLAGKGGPGSLLAALAFALPAGVGIAVPVAIAFDGISNSRLGISWAMSVAAVAVTVGILASVMLPLFLGFDITAFIGMAVVLAASFVLPQME